MFYVVVVTDQSSPCDFVYPAKTLDRAVSYAKHQRKSYYAVVFDENKQKMFEHGTPPGWDVEFSDYIH